MYKINLDKKTGFRVRDNSIPILIRDNRGIMFYSTDGMDVEQFNLPTGCYLVDSGMFTALTEPVDYKLIDLPPKQRLKKNPANFDVRFGPNPNKCSVIWHKNLILFDTSFKEKPMPQLDFILGHEFGHRFYITESYADMYAANRMLKMGYNPSQIGDGQIMSLSERQISRKNNIVQNLINKR